MVGLLWLLAFLAVGEAASRLLHLPVPGNVLGMLLLTLALSARLIRLEVVKPTADFLVRHMALFFVPAGVGIMRHGELVRREWLPLLVASVASTLAVLATVGWLQQRIER